MFWKNAKTLKYEYIQRGRDVVSAPHRFHHFGKSSTRVCVCLSL